MAGRVRLLRPLLRHLMNAADVAERRLIGGRRGPSLSVRWGVERECEALQLVDVEPVVVLGGALEFSTMHRNIEDWLMGPIGLAGTNPGGSLALLVVPRHEGTTVSWRPIILGHELAHLAFSRNDGLAAFDLDSRFDFGRASQTPIPGETTANMRERVLWLHEVAEAWTEELVCDANTLRRFGPAGIAAVGEFLHAVGALDVPRESHPHGRFRLEMMLSWLNESIHPRVDAILDPARELASESATQLEDWAVFLGDLFRDANDDLMAIALSWPGDTYDYVNRGEIVDSISSLLELGVPGARRLESEGQLAAVVDADIANATWVSKVEDQPTPTTELALKALEDLEFLRSWTEAGGTIEDDDNENGSELQVDGLAILTAAAIADRMGPPENGSLVVTPLLPGYAKDAAMDVRLGNQFIVFERRRITHLDPLQLESDPRAIQSRVELRWDESFVLHPNELVLASTLEYFVFPDDIAAQVVTRSSYGRLGLLTATAVLVHPRFRGCLTLELVNLSNLPIQLKPGERIAQLVFMSAGPPTRESRPKYDCPTGPQFSKVRGDEEATVLRALGHRGGAT